MARDYKGVWRQATIKKLDGFRTRIHFPGGGLFSDEWHLTDDDTIQVREWDSDMGRVYVLRGQLTEELQCLCVASLHHFTGLCTRSYKSDYPDGCPWALCLFIAAQP